MRHIYDNTKVKIGMIPVVLSATSTPVQFIDTLGYNDGMLIVSSGAVTATGTDIYTVSVLEGDATASMATVTNLSINTLTFGFVSGAAESSTVKVLRIPDLGVTRKRYLQMTIVASATTVSFAGSAQFALSNPDSGPSNTP